MPEGGKDVRKAPMTQGGFKKRENGWAIVIKNAGLLRSGTIDPPRALP